MSRAVQFSDETCAQLEEMAHNLGIEDIELLIKQLLWEAELRRREELGRRVDEHREEMFARYGLMRDNAALVREDRER